MRESQVALSDTRVWGGKYILKDYDISDAEIDAYLWFCRQLTRELAPQGSHFIPIREPDEAKSPDNEEKVNALTSDELPAKRSRRPPVSPSASLAIPSKTATSFRLRPLESDEQALEFLHQAKYNISFAKFLLLSLHGVGIESDAMEVSKRLATIQGEVSAANGSRSAKSFTEDEDKHDGSPREDDHDEDETTFGELQRSSNVKKWLATAKATIAGKIPPTRRMLISLQRELEKQLYGRTDMKLATTLKDLSVQLSSKLNAVDEWIANAHDAASLLKPDTHWTLEELQDLINSAPSGVKLAELTCLQTLYEECLAVKLEATTALEQVTHLKVINALFKRVERMPIEMPELRELERRAIRASEYAEKIRALVPCSEYWQTMGGRRGAAIAASMSTDWKPQCLETLRELRDETLSNYVTFRELAVLEHFIAKTHGWMARINSALESNADVKKLLELVKEADTLPLDVSKERAQLDEQLKRMQQCIAKVKSAVPRQSKTRGAGLEVQKMEIETLRDLKEEAASIGIKPNEVEEMGRVLELADNWKLKVESLLNNVETVDIATLEELLDEVDEIPVLMTEEDLVRAHIRSHYCCEKATKALDDKVELDTLLRHSQELGSIRREINGIAGNSSSLTETKAVEAKLRKAITQAQIWTTRVHFICRIDEPDPRPSNKGKRKKKYRVPKKKLHGPFASSERISFKEFSELYEEGKTLPVNVSRLLQAMEDLETEFSPLRLELAEYLRRSRQREAESLVVTPASERCLQRRDPVLGGGETEGNGAKGEHKADGDVDMETEPKSAGERKSPTLNLGAQSTLAGTGSPKTEHSSSENGSSSVTAQPTKQMALKSGLPLEAAGGEKHLSDAQTSPMEISDATRLSAHEEGQTIEPVQAPVASDATPTPVEGENQAGGDTSRASSSNGDGKVFYELSELEEKLEMCQMFAVKTEEEALFEEAVQRTREWVKTSSRICQTTQVEDMSSLAAGSDGFPSIESTAELIAVADSLMIDPTHFVVELESVLTAMRKWSAQAESVCLMYSNAAKLAAVKKREIAKAASSAKTDTAMENGETQNGREAVVVSDRRTRHKGKKESKSAAPVDKDQRDRALGIAPHSEETLAKFEASDLEISDRVKDTFGVGLGAPNALQLRFLDCKTPLKDNSSVEPVLSIDGEQSQIGDTLFGPDFANVVVAARVFAAQLERAGVSVVVKGQKSVRLALWLAEVSVWLEAVETCKVRRSPISIDAARNLIAEGMCLLHGEMVPGTESKASSTTPDLLTILGIMHASPNLPEAVLPFGRLGVGAEDLTDLEPREDNSNTEDVSNADGTLSHKVALQLCELREMASKALSWDKFAQRKLSQVKSIEDMLALRLLLEDKRALGVIVETPSEVSVLSEMSRLHRWLAKVRPFLARERGYKAPSLALVESYVQEAGKLKVTPPELKLVRGFLKDAKTWVTNVRKATQKSSGSREEHQELLNTAKTIPLDLTEYSSALDQATQLYCVCRRPFSDIMVECSDCSNWYHIKCINVTPSNARRIGRYVCPKCYLTRSVVAHSVLAKAAIARVRIGYSARKGSSEHPTSSTEILPSGVESWEQQSFQFLERLHAWVRETEKLFEPPCSTDDEAFAATYAEYGGDEKSSEFEMCADGIQIRDALQFRNWANSLRAALPKDQSLPSLTDLSNVVRLAGENPILKSHPYQLFWAQALRRARSWGSRARAVLRSGPTVDKSITIRDCEDLLEIVRYIPVHLLEEKSINACLEDGANRYCTCKLFNDGNFMINCDICEGWYHGHCVNVTQAVGEKLNSYTCPNCAANNGEPYRYPRPTLTDN